MSPPLGEVKKLNKDKIDAMYDLLLSTSDVVAIHKENFKIIETEFNKLNDNLAATKMINSFLVGSLSAASDEFKASLKFSIEQMLSSGHVLPGDFEKQAKNLLSAVCGSPVQESQKPSFRLLHGGKNDSDK